MSIQVIECIDCFYEVLAEDLSSNKSLNFTLNTKYSYRIRIELTNTSYCLQTVSPSEHGSYLLNVESSSTNSSSDIHLQCFLTTQRLANNIYIPLIVAGILLLILLLSCIIGQRLKVNEYFKTIQKRFLKKSQAQETAHSYDLQSTVPAETANAAETSPTVTRLPPIQKMTSVIVPRSKRLLSLDAFRGLSK